MDPKLANAIIMALLRRLGREGDTITLAEDELVLPAALNYRLVDCDGDVITPGSTDWTACLLTLLPPGGTDRH